MSEHVRVKICGLMRRQDVEAAERAGADYVGVILSAGFDRSVEPAQAGELVRGVSPTPVAVLVDERPEDAQARAASMGARILQLHGDESPEVVRETAARWPWTVWKSIRVRRIEDVERAVDRYGAIVQGLLLEGFREGVVGGGGVRLDIDALLTARSEVPDHLEVILAGGLRPDTVEDAVARFRPDVVDVSSGVERERGRKDPELLLRFVEAARRAPVRETE